MQSKDYHSGSDQIQCRIEVLKPERTAQHRISIHELRVQKNEEGNKDLREELHQIYPKDKLLTKTMINNYAKAGILIPPRQKKYSRQHIETLLMLYNAKQILSINDISLLFSILQEPAYRDWETDRKSTRLNSSHITRSRMPSSA